LSYFYRDKQEFICYLKLNYNKDFYDYNTYFKQKYKNVSAEDNGLEFIPHISFLKILNLEKFLIYKNDIEDILVKELKKLDKLDINNYSISVYWANSKIVPELQFKI